MSSSKAKTKTANPDEDQPSLKDLLERMEIMNLQTKESILGSIDDKFAIVEKRLVSLEERSAKSQWEKSEKQVFLVEEKVDGPVKVAEGLNYSKFQIKTLVEPDMETETKNFLIEESSGKVKFPRLSDINEEGLGKFTFPKVQSKSPAIFLMRISDSKCWTNYAAFNQWLRENPTCIPGDSYFLPNLFTFWAEENLIEANGQGGFFKILILCLFNALAALRINRFTEFLYLYTMYWDIQ